VNITESATDRTKRRQ